ncbi:MAG: UdgX family uracil-DNA binding protein [Alphaproteobacteria bacterium]|nr:UdgX family uracil-DNA binding protein [Alphaproteobacteria bacterium]
MARTQLSLGFDDPAGAAGGTAAALIPPNPTLASLRSRAADCTACPLYKNATQTVFGEGPAHAPLMLVGETPGDREDVEGHPFVGPAGKLLDQCLEEAGIDRAEAYVSNVVKHFKWVPRGKRRLHQKPNAMEIRACTPWLAAEIALVKPRVLVALGATAAQALFGSAFRVSRQRGEPVATNLAPHALATVHPSALLRTEDADRAEAIRHFVDDLRRAARALRREAP